MSDLKSDTERAGVWLKPDTEGSRRRGNEAVATATAGAFRDLPRRRRGSSRRIRFCGFLPGEQERRTAPVGAARSVEPAPRGKAEPADASLLELTDLELTFLELTDLELTFLELANLELMALEVVLELLDLAVLEPACVRPTSR